MEAVDGGEKAGIQVRRVQRKRMCLALDLGSIEFRGNLETLSR